MVRQVEALSAKPVNLNLIFKTHKVKENLPQVVILTYTRILFNTSVHTYKNK